MSTKTAAHTITMDDLEGMLDAAGFDDYSIRDDYSGRGMYGATCVGITVPARDVPGLFAAIGRAAGYAEGADIEDGPDWDRFLDAARQDSMGVDVIVYFPRWALSA